MFGRRDDIFEVESSVVNSIVLRCDELVMIISTCIDAFIKLSASSLRQKGDKG
jgi:hypothetical protein